LVTGCTRSTLTSDLVLLSGIAPPHIRRNIISQKERNKQIADLRHNLFGHEPIASRLSLQKDYPKCSFLNEDPAKARMAMLALAYMANSEPHPIWICCDSSSKVKMGILIEQANCQCVALRCDIPPTQQVRFF